MRRCVTPAVGCQIVAVSRPRSRLQPIVYAPAWPRFCRRVVGQTIVAVDRLGKRVVLVLDSADRIVIEPRMSGLVLLSDPPDQSHVRLVLELEPTRSPLPRAKRRFTAASHVGEGPGVRVVRSGNRPKSSAPSQLVFWDQRGLGVVRLLRPAEFAAVCGPTRLGPDALEITLEQLIDALGRSTRAIKVALLDQKALLGVGNLYASELLHRAGVHPARPCARLRREQWQRILAAMREVLAEAIVHQGSTLRDGTYRIAREETGQFQFRLRVYQRHGQKCLQCNRGEIVRIVQAQRSTFFCPLCQRKR